MAFGDEILAMIKEIEEQDTIKMTRCPECEWALEETEEGSLHCPYCGWSEGLGGNHD